MFHDEKIEKTFFFFFSKVSRRWLPTDRRQVRERLIYFCKVQSAVNGETFRIHLQREY